MPSFVAIILQTTIIYLLMVASLRLFGKKELAQLSIIDLVFILLISNSVQNAMVGSSKDFVGGLMSAGALFVVNYLLKTLIYRSPKISNWIEGEPLVLIYKGDIHLINIEKAQITNSELEAAVREHGVDSVKKVDLAMLEIDGSISVLSNDFSRQSSRKRKVHRSISKQ